MPADDQTPAPVAGRSVASRVVTVGIFAVTGFMIAMSAISAKGTDLRADRTASLRELVTAQAARNEQLRGEAADLRADVERLAAAQDIDPALPEQVRQAGLVAQTVPVRGPGMRVTLSDAPADVRPAGVDDDALVVHQQDIQAVVNALWAGGAEAMTIQGQRVISTTGIKCVGNSVVLHGIPYAPPYVIEAIGPADAMRASLAASPAVVIYRQYVDAFGLGYREATFDDAQFPAFVGSIDVALATPGG